MATPVAAICPRIQSEATHGAMHLCPVARRLNEGPAGHHFALAAIFCNTGFQVRCSSWTKAVASAGDIARV
jgi:hypothetical protein